MTRGSGSDATGVHLWLLLWKATKAVEAHAQGSVRETGLCLSDFGVLEALLHKGPLPVNVLGRKVLLTSGSMTVAVDRLERRGLVERSFSAKDRRTRIIRLTEKGSRLIRGSFFKHAQDMEGVFLCLSRTEKSGLASLLRKLGHTEDNHAARESNAIQSKEQRRRS